ncbi:MAG: exodeoxyribonuclease VII small subunit [Candidatus Omnitrophica bacterium]|nr:exodeoxyribonuclease VII small subunit [Candidatus Omnitrophota bacterium]
MDEFKFEKAVEKLEGIVEFLEGGEATLDESLKKYEEGVKISRLCAQKLAEAEKKIEILTRTLNGSMNAEPFCPEEGAAPEKKTKAGPAGTPKPGAADEDNPEGLLF